MVESRLSSFSGFGTQMGSRDTELKLPDRDKYLFSNCIRYGLNATYSGRILL